MFVTNGFIISYVDEKSVEIVQPKIMPLLLEIAGTIEPYKKAITP